MPRGMLTSKRVAKALLKGGKPSLRDEVRSLRKKVRQISGVQETKQITNAFSSSPTASASVIDYLSQCSQGDAENTRDGDEVRCQSLRISGRLVASSTGTQCQLVRLIVFQDKQQVLATNPTAAEVMGTSAPTINELPNFDNYKRFHIMWDQTFGVEPLNTGSNPGVGKYSNRLHIDKWLKPPNDLVRYDGSGTNCEKNGIYMLLISEQTVAPTFTYQVGFRFKG